VTRHLARRIKAVGGAGVVTCRKGGWPTSDVCMNGTEHEQKQSGQATALLRARGNRVTPQRRTILSIIQQQGGHLSADEIYHLARTEVPRLSLSTVYRTLELLKDLDLVSELHLAGDHYRYEVQAGEHQHLVCLSCGKVLEFLCAHCTETHRTLADQHGFKITTSRVELFGYCEECSKASDN
jgi:Fe2+ or Zn2+ uptake regulation protein